MSVYEFGCDDCGGEVEFTGTLYSADGVCPGCGKESNISPGELYESNAAEAAYEAAQDARYE